MSYELCNKNVASGPNVIPFSRSCAGVEPKLCANAAHLHSPTGLASIYCQGVLAVGPKGRKVPCNASSCIDLPGPLGIPWTELKERVWAGEGVDAAYTVFIEAVVSQCELSPRGLKTNKF